MKTSLQTFFDDYAAALTSYSAESISEYYNTPVAIYSDEGIQAVTKASDTIAFWREGVKPYKAQGIEKAKAKVIHEEQLSNTTFTAKVLWNNYDNSGKEVSSETNFYILSKKEDGLKISGLILMLQVDKGN